MFFGLCSGMFEFVQVCLWVFVVAVVVIDFVLDAGGWP